MIKYDMKTGKFTSKGREVGYIHQTTGYRMVWFGKKRWVPAHRLAFQCVTGRIPEFVDHINGIRDDNRWENLRACTRLENAMNKRKYKNNTTGVTGVAMTKEGRYRVELSKKYLGTYDTLLDAAAVRIAAQNLAGFSERHGK